MLSARVIAALQGAPGGSSLRVPIGVAAYFDNGPTRGDLAEAADAAIITAAPRTLAHAYLASASEVSSALLANGPLPGSACHPAAQFVVRAPTA